MERSLAMTDAAVQQLMSRAVLCWLATVDQSGYPNVSPKEIFCVADSGLLLIANIASPGSQKNIHTNTAIFVSFVDLFAQKGFKIKGLARVIGHRDQAFQTVVAPLQQLAGDRFVIASVFVVEAQTVEPIVAPSYRFYPETQEHDQIASAMRRYGVQSLEKKW